MATMEYEVREEYRDFTAKQLLESAVTVFQGVGDTQSEILHQYFGVTTVKDLAELTAFEQALGVQEKVLEGGADLKKSIADLGGQKLDFSIRPNSQHMRLSDLPSAPVHVLEGLTPGQDLAFYDAFRITSLTQLAHNRIMLEARVIAYLAGQEGDGGATSEAVASILGQRAAATQHASQRHEAGDDNLAHLTGEVTSHVRDRVEAMRSRTVGRGHDSAEPKTSAASKASAVRAEREQGTTINRAADLARIRGESSAGGSIRTGGSRNRADEIVASRSTTGTRSGAGGTVSGASGLRASGSRLDALAAARGTRVSSAVVKPGTKADKSKGGTTTAVKEPATQAAAKAPVLKTASDLRPGAPARRRRQPQRRVGPPPALLLAAAVLAVLLLVGLIYLLSPSDEGTAPDQAGTTQDSGTGTPSGAAGGESSTTAGTGAGTAPGSGTGTGAGTAPGTGTGASAATTAPTGRGAASTYTVTRGDTLWGISESEYRDPFNWPSIYMENKGDISHPDMIYPDQRFRIPQSPEYRYPEYPKNYTPRY